MFSIKGNLCGDRIRLGRAMHKPPLTQEKLARKIQFLGMTDMTTNIIAKIESNDRHVIDAELLMISKALGVTMEWLVGESNEPYSKSSIFKNE